MNIMLISQCHKNALKESRRVLDQFAERKGNRTWQTAITFEGLKTLRKMLRKNARRNTAVACHWLKKSGQSELLWVVGRQNAFNEKGTVPTNTTSRNIIKNKMESSWQSGEVIALSAGIAGLFHDFGKANTLFQGKLHGTSKTRSEPYRHEWVSLRLFEAFAKNLSDNEWLIKLESIGFKNNAIDIEKQTLEMLFHDGVGKHQNPFKYLAPFARLIAWLVVSHHRLPLPTDPSMPLSFEKIDDIEQWLERSFSAHWNSSNALNDWPEEALTDNWVFPQGTPLLSKAWQDKAQQLGKRAIACTQIDGKHWLHQRFTSHLARLSLMLSDHYYSSLPSNASKEKWRDTHYEAFANTDRSVKTKKPTLKQKLDEHNIGVGHNALFLARSLPTLKHGLPSIARHKIFSQRVKKEKFKWQDKAFDLARSIGHASKAQGFFGVNMASTGCGKTFANARVMYGLAGEKEGCRFNVALGLRTLTLQTGDAYREILKLDDDDLAVMIGSQAVKELHELSKKQPKDTQTHKPDYGSESEEYFSEHMYVSYEGEIYDGRLKHWLSSSPKLQKMISAPILVSTIDHLIPATDGLRGGKQIAPMLRLLTSDLVLDEPDDFDMADLPALCRLVNWAGMLGSRVLLSSATLPPSLVTALYQAYYEGRKAFNDVHAEHDRNEGVICAWFDEYQSLHSDINHSNEFKKAHTVFVDTRIKKLSNKLQDGALRKGKLARVESGSPELSFSQCVWHQLHDLHLKHHVVHDSGQCVSVGVVRMANIDPLVAVAKHVISMAPQADFTLHYCIYHSQFPMALRSYVESKLDGVLTRYDEEQLWQQPEIANALKNKKNTQATKHHVFIVLGTSVVEVGRDHDYDWAIAEPSSLRSLIQLAGRVQRHRQLVPTDANMVVLNKNIKALKGVEPAYCKPGFESIGLPFASHDLSALIGDELTHISSIPRISEPVFKNQDFLVSNSADIKNKKLHNAAYPAKTFVVQEHRALILSLFANNQKPPTFYRTNKEASLWWNYNIDWHGEYIKQTPFRKSEKQDEFVLHWPEDEAPHWAQVDDMQYPIAFVPQTELFTTTSMNIAPNVHWWFTLDAEHIYTHYSDQLDRSTERVSEEFGRLHLRAPRDGEETNWFWSPYLGVFKLRPEQ